MITAEQATTIRALADALTAAEIAKAATSRYDPNRPKVQARWHRADAALTAYLDGLVRQ